MKLLKIEEIKRPLIVGEKVLVPCVLEIIDGTEEWGIIDGEEGLIKKSINWYIPVHPTLHTDKHNGQIKPHYHYDERFGILITDGRKKMSLRHILNIRPEPNKFGLIYKPMKVKQTGFKSTTPIELISKSKLKHKCVHNGKCPHRGHDLSQVEPIDGVIKCPLHGLRFDAETKNILPEDLKIFGNK